MSATLWGTVQHEGATKGIMITTSGYGPDSYKFAGGKPLNLIDGSGLLALCHQYEIPARILNPARENQARKSRNNHATLNEPTGVYAAIHHVPHRAHAEECTR